MRRYPRRRNRAGLTQLAEVYEKRARLTGPVPRRFAEDLGQLVSLDDCFEVDLAFVFDEQPLPRTEWAYNPFLGLSPSFEERVRGYLAARSLDLELYDWLTERLPFYLADLTIGAEYEQGGPGKLSLGFESLERHVRGERRRELTALLADRFHVAADHLRPYEQGKLNGFFVDFAEGRLLFSRFFHRYEPEEARAAEAAIGRTLDRGRREELRRFVDTVSTGAPAVWYLVYEKFTPEGRPAGVKFYKTYPYAATAPDWNGDPSAAWTEIRSFLAPYSADHRALAGLAALERLCAEREVSLTPSLLSLAFPLGRPPYLALYLAVTDQPRESGG